MVVATFTQQAVDLAPGVVLAGHHTMLDPGAMSEVKVVVNCGKTRTFLEFLDNYQPVISSDVIVLNLDPYTSSTDAAYRDLHARFNRVLQNYLAFFYSYNQDVHFYVNSNYQNSKLSLDSPTMNGIPLKLLFNINRLLTLIKNMNGSADFLFVSDTFGLKHASNALIYALAILYLMDNYNYNFEASYRFLQSLIVPTHIMSSNGSHFLNQLELLNADRHDDVLLIDSLKKFHMENGKIKQAENGVMTTNFKLKRGVDSMDSGYVMRSVKRRA